MNMAAPQRWQETSPFPSWKRLHCTDVPCNLHGRADGRTQFHSFQPTWKCSRSHASVHTIRQMASRILCQNSWCPFGIRQSLCCIACHQLQVKYTFPTNIGWVVLILLILTPLSPQDDTERLIIDQYSGKGYHKHAASCAISENFLNIFAFTRSPLWHNCLNIPNPFLK